MAWPMSVLGDPQHGESELGQETDPQPESWTSRRMSSSAPGGSLTRIVSRSRVNKA